MARYGRFPLFLSEKLLEESAYAALFLGRGRGRSLLFALLTSIASKVRGVSALRAVSARCGIRALTLTVALWVTALTGAGIAARTLSARVAITIARTLSAAIVATLAFTAAITIARTLPAAIIASRSLTALSASALRSTALRATGL